MCAIILRAWAEHYPVTLTNIEILYHRPHVAVLSCRRGNDASNHVTWDFDASTMVRPTKSTEDGADSNSASSAATTSTSTTTAAASNQRTNDQDSLTPTESNHKVLFSEEGEGQGEEPPVSPQLGIDETAMVLESGSRKSIVEGAEKRNSVVLVGEDGVDGHNSVGRNAVGHEKVSLSDC